MWVEFLATFGVQGSGVGIKIVIFQLDGVYLFVKTSFNFCHMVSL